MKPSTALRMPRGQRGTVATLTAVLGLAACAAVATEAILVATHEHTKRYGLAQIARFGRRTEFGDTVVLVVAVAAIVVGALLLLAALVPARRRVVELREPEPTVAAGLTRKSFRRTLAAAAEAVDGVSTARVTGRRRLSVKATTAFRDTSALPDRITERVTARIDALDPAQHHRVRVTLRRKED